MPETPEEKVVTDAIKESKSTGQPLAEEVRVAAARARMDGEQTEAIKRSKSSGVQSTSPKSSIALSQDAIAQMHKALAAAVSKDMRTSSLGGAEATVLAVAKQLRPVSPSILDKISKQLATWALLEKNVAQAAEVQNVADSLAKALSDATVRVSIPKEPRWSQFVREAAPLVKQGNQAAANQMAKIAPSHIEELRVLRAQIEVLRTESAETQEALRRSEEERRAEREAREAEAQDKKKATKENVAWASLNLWAQIATIAAIPLGIIALVVGIYFGVQAL